MRRKLLKHGWGILMTSKPRIKLAFFWFSRWIKNDGLSDNPWMIRFQLQTSASRSNLAGWSSEWQGGDRGLHPVLGEWWNRAECDAHQAKRRWARCGVVLVTFRWQLMKQYMNQWILSVATRNMQKVWGTCQASVLNIYKLRLQIFQHVQMCQTRP